MSAMSDNQLLDAINRANNPLQAQNPPPLDLRSPFQKFIDGVQPKKPLGPYVTPEVQKEIDRNRQAAAARNGAAGPRAGASGANGGARRRRRSHSNNGGGSHSRTSGSNSGGSRPAAATPATPPAVQSPKATYAKPSDLLEAIEKFRQDNGGSKADWAKFKTDNEMVASIDPALAPNPIAPAGVDLEAAGKIYADTLRKSYDGAFASLKALGMPEYLNPEHLTKLGFDPKVDPKTISPHRYAHALATFQAREAVDKYVLEHQVSLNNNPAPAEGLTVGAGGAAPATPGSDIATDANTTPVVASIDLKLPPAELAVKLDSISEGGVARFTQMSGANNLLIHDYARHDGKFIQTVDGKTRGDALTTDDLVLRTQSWTKTAEKFSFETSGNSRLDLDRYDPTKLRKGTFFEGMPDWRNEWRMGQRADFGEFSFKADMEKRYGANFQGARITAEASSDSKLSAETTGNKLVLEVGGNKPSDASNPTLLSVEQGGVATRTTVPGMSA